MNLELTFTLCFSASAIGWLVLFIFPKKSAVNFWLCGTIIPCAIAVAYAALCLVYWNTVPYTFLQRFGSTAGMLAMFNGSPGLLMAGFVHYLAFDLFVGAWEARRATQAGWPYLLLLPCLALTLLFGPAGLLLHELILIFRGQHQPEHVPLRPGA
jgi:hypothetical protein